MLSSVCSELISRAKDYPTTYNRRLFNHLPMMLLALDKMGATSEQLTSSFDNYIERFTDHDNYLDPANPIKQQTEILQQQYLLQLNDQGIKPIISSALLFLMPGVAAGVFYPFTRLANAVVAEDFEEIAIALACWHTYYLDLGEIRECADKKPGSLLRSTAKIVAHYRFPAGNSIDRMASVLDLEQYYQSASQPLVINFEIVATAVLSTYQMTGDFTMHHCVVAIKSFATLRDYFDDEELALRYFWQAVVVAYLSTGGAPMAAAEQVELIDWSEIKAFCCDCSNEHLIEICYACEIIQQQTGHISGHRIASRLVHYNR
ncbi:MAG: DUF4243 domain-containing protein [Gammaproteobacteria bacterium]|nr:DUF4243 domain-containing protein [Gammaproteobacteria bacterium]